MAEGARLQPAQPQRWDLFPGAAQALSAPDGRGELRAWALLGLAALAVAGVFALMIAMSRVPHLANSLPWPETFFQNGLIIHVIMSFVVWFLAVLGALSTLAAYRLADGTPRLRVLGPLGLAAVAVAVPLLFVPAFLPSAAPSLNNYVPVLIHPVYYAGLALTAIGITLVVLRTLANVVARRGPLEPVSASAVAAGTIFLVAMAAGATAWQFLGARPLDAAANEDLFWGLGHALQFANTAVLVGGWYVLGGRAAETPFCPPKTMALALGLLMLPAASLLTFYGLFPPFSAAQNHAFTLAQWAMLPGPLLAAVAGLSTARAAWRRDAMPPAALALWLSLLVFALGGFLGAFVDGTDTRTPAHYHGMIGGINLTYMGLYFVFFLPLTGRAIRIGRAVKAVFWFYACGQALHALGLFMAGGYGAPRKVAGDWGFEALGAKIGLYMMGVGAVGAVIGGVMFVWIAAKALLGSPGKSTGS